MNQVDFYKRYDDLRAKITAFDAERPQIQEVKAQEKQMELNQETSQLFDEFMGRHINLLA